MSAERVVRSRLDDVQDYCYRLVLYAVDPHAIHRAGSVADELVVTGSLDRLPAELVVKDMQFLAVRQPEPAVYGAEALGMDARYGKPVLDMELYGGGMGGHLT